MAPDHEFHGSMKALDSNGVDAFRPEQPGAKVFVTVYWYQVKAGNETAAIAHHQAWERDLSPSAQGFLCSELLVNPQDPGEFLWLLRFAEEKAAWTLYQSAHAYAWYAQLVLLAEVGPMVTHFELVLPNHNRVGGEER